jgi:hypothetical protein
MPATDDPHASSDVQMHFAAQKPRAELLQRLPHKHRLSRQKCFNGSPDVGSTHWTVSQPWSTVATRHNMAARQEHRAGILVQTDFTLSRLDQSTILLQEALLFVCVQNNETMIFKDKAFQSTLDYECTIIRLEYVNGIADTSLTKP